jgi:predicted O-methyltransferase YrrM
MKKMHQSIVLNNLEQFKLEHPDQKLMRQNLEMFLYWKIIEYIKPNSILEIGVYAGQTLGLMIEASGFTNGIYTGVDVDFNHLSTFKLLFNDVNVEFLEIPSNQLNLGAKYDIIHIDGDHTYQGVSNDISKVIPYLHSNSILIVDDYVLPEVDQAIDDLLTSKIGLIPFMQGHQTTFFCKESNNLSYFLDDYIYKNSVNDFINLNNIDYKGYTVLKGNLFNIFVKHHHLFLQALKLYNI